MDGVINLSSTVGMQTLIWDIPNYQIGKYFADYFSRNFERDIDSLGTPLKEFEIENYEKVLYWMISHYIIPASYYSNAKWLVNYWKELKNGNNYPVVDNDKNLLEAYINMLSDKAPERIKDSKEKIYYNIHTSMANKHFSGHSILDSISDKAEKIIIYGKGSIGYLLEREIQSDSKWRDRFGGFIDRTSYMNYKYSGKETIIITPVLESYAIKESLRKVTDSSNISAEELLKDE